MKGNTVLSKILELLNSDEWPAAITPAEIAREGSDKDCFERADYILNDVIKINLSNKKVLDFGCGSGHLVARGLAKGVKIFGYDKKFINNHLWKEHDYNFTHYWLKILSNGPFDLVIYNDVFDHSEFPLEDLMRIKTVIAPNGVAFIRCHPICSRHGGHIHNTFNKAFAHMVLSDKELGSLGLELPIQRVLYPLATYETYIKKAGLKIDSKNVVRSQVEPFFKENQIIADRLSAFYSGQSKGSIPEFQMGQSYIDFVVSRA
jgi:SAM-dependent methyltransferase